MGVKKIARRIIQRYPNLPYHVLGFLDFVAGMDTGRRKQRSLSRRFISFKPQGHPKGNILISLHLQPFLLRSGEPINHPAYWANHEIAQIYLDLGYAVDVIHWRNKYFVPQKKYTIFVDYHANLERLAPLLNPNCIKIMHIDSTHWLFHATAQHQRMLDLQRRKGVTLPLTKMVEPNRGIEIADCAVTHGNQFVLDTFRYANKPIYQVPQTSSLRWDWFSDKDIEQARRHFLWFGSSGLVHKGLDLVLEAFAQMPEYHLSVCGPISLDKKYEEVEFCNAFHRELYELPNIHTHGWINIASQEFVELAKKCIAIVFPSCSECSPSGVINCMNAGLIPVVLRETDINVGDFGYLLRDESISAIKDAVKEIAQRPAEELLVLSRKTWEHARENYTREKFSRAYRNIAETLITSERV